MRLPGHALAAVGSVLLLAGSAHGGDKQECVAAYEQAQILRKAHDLRGSQEQLVTCARNVCPAVLRHDCVPWLAEVTAATPSIVVEAVDARGGHVEGAKAFVDGVAVSGDGPTVLNPGAHRVRIEAPGSAPVEQSVDLAEGDVRHVVRVTLVPLVPPATSSPAAPLPVAAIAFGGVAVAGLTTFAIFGAIGNGKKSDLDAEKCSPNCSASAVSAIRTDYVTADVAVGVGLASAALATYFFFTRPTRTPKVDVTAGPGGGFVSLTQRF